jgi:protein SCO1
MKRNTNNTFRAILSFGTALGVLAVGAAQAAAQDVPLPSQPPAAPSANNSTPAPPVVNPALVGLDQKLDSQIPLGAEFLDDTGKRVKLGDYYGSKKPVVLCLIFYKCAGVCMRELDGMIELMNNPQMTLAPGKDYELVVVSINPQETPELAAAKKKSYMDLLGKPEVERGWHYLTGKPADIQKLAASIGFRYAYDVKSDQFAHPAGLILTTPAGKVSKYFYGASWPAKDVRLALVEASGNHIGTLSDKIMLNCIYQYDPTTGRYGFGIITAMRIGAVLTMLALVCGVVTMSVRSGRKNEGLSAVGAAGGVQSVAAQTVQTVKPERAVDGRSDSLDE